jgi:hypothetical protein
LPAGGHAHAGLDYRPALARQPAVDDGDQPRAGQAGHYQHSASYDQTIAWALHPRPAVAYLGALQGGKTRAAWAGRLSAHGIYTHMR